MLRKYACVSFIVVLAVSLISGLVFGAAKVKLEVMHFGWGWTKETADVLRQFDEYFMKKYPHIEVKSTAGPQDASATKLILMVTSGVAPDVAWAHNDPTWARELIKAGFFKDLTPYIKREKDFNLPDFIPQVMGNYMRGDKIYALPVAASPQVFAYNVDLLDERGLVAPHKDWTLDEFLNYARKLTIDKNGDKIPDIWGMADYGYGGVGPIMPWDAIVYLAPFGARLFNDDGTKILLTEPNALRAVNWWFDLSLKHKVVGGSFKQGNAAIAFESAAVLPSYADLPFKWDITHLPKGPAGRATVVAPWGGFYGIISATKHPEEAWTYLKEFMSTEGQRMTIPNFGPCRSRFSAWDLRFRGAPPSMKIVPEMIKEYGVPMAGYEEVIHSIMFAEMVPAMKGEKAIEEACQNVKKLGERELQKWREGK